MFFPICVLISHAYLSLPPMISHTLQWMFHFFFLEYFFHFLLGIYFIYISNAIPEVTYTLHSIAPLPTHSHFLALVFPLYWSIESWQYQGASLPSEGWLGHLLLHIQLGTWVLGVLVSSYCWGTQDLNTSIVLTKVKCVLWNWLWNDFPLKRTWILIKEAEEMVTKMY
jgi:hypothetical protein